ncbi:MULTISPECIES: winged helix-turn-helix domain-containing protein [Pseudomonas]|jgi:cholera toxin transcriptional activator|uniref:DNA-binding winged helix-turn-helix (WHTH) domain-containing protein n=1 Tax=Pseudomonas psychrophila TaxID=122355 RepID=A0A8I1FLT6_9PSED|nr:MULTISPECIES: winged helix-turn-helix domain-containing protein [Pseudomonas]EPJ94768.1 putative transcriptional regulator [Pseudomonas psychrophila]KAB0493210.1 transcriptional regulator [Pseudomonas psychrophila]KMN02912.1 transcriptional regulator [Pseudomonas psychrophila]KOX64247.1 transcriptional regulator [Pseudomonas psychrophila]MBJ2254978.1 winged helix-turn-helix domain-containing protein [Pseudomonas psychrophila]
MARYLIAGVMLFDDELYEVSGPGDVVQSVVLGAAASRCFSTLLEAQGSIVTKKELLHAGWERYGQQVCANSVNQSIAQIRRCLSSVGHCDYVVTVPRIGYKVSDALSIEKLGDCTQPAPGDDLSCGHDIKPVRLMQDDQVVGPANKKLGTSKSLLLGGLLLFNSLLAFGWQSMQLSTPLSAAIELNYLPVPAESGLHLFSAPGLNASPERINAHLLKLKEKPPAFTALGSYAYVYLNGALRDDVYGYFLCRDPIEVSVSGCISYFVVEGAES